jgi:hypothetical protein
MNVKIDADQRFSFGDVVAENTDIRLAVEELGVSQERDDGIKMISASRGVEGVTYVVSASGIQFEFTLDDGGTSIFMGGLINPEMVQLFEGLK